jgi:hypothetical protein
LDILYNNPESPVQPGDILKLFVDLPTTPAGIISDPTTKKVHSPGAGGIGVRGGIGTDISGGLVFGGSLNYMTPADSNPFEMGLVVFTGRFTETSEDVHVYEEQTDILVFGLFGNYLINYRMRSSGIFFLVGTGMGYIEVGWEERSNTDETLGTPLPEGGSKQIEEGSVFGFIADFGLGYKFTNKVDIRLEVPVFFITNTPGNTSSIVPTSILTLGIRFN